MPGLTAVFIAAAVISAPVQEVTKDPKRVALVLKVRPGAHSGVVREFTRMLDGIGRQVLDLELWYGPPLADRLGEDPVLVFEECGTQISCIAAEGRRAKVDEVLYGRAAAMEGGQGARIEILIIDTERTRILRKAKLRFANKSEVRPVLEREMSYLFGMPGLLEDYRRSLARTKALELWDQADAQLELGNIQKAIEHMEEAYTLNADPVFLFKLAKANEALGNNKRAVQLLEQYRPHATDLAEVDALLSSLRPPQKTTQVDSTKKITQTTSASSLQRFSWVGVSGAIVAAAGVLSLGAGALLGLNSTSKKNEFESLKRGEGGDSQLRAKRLLKDSNRAASRANLAYVLGSVATVLGGAAFATDFWLLEWGDGVLVDGSVGSAGASVTVGFRW